MNDAILITNKTHQSKEEWNKHIHHLVEQNNVTYMDAIIDLCDDNEIDIDHVSKLIDDNIKAKIRLEAESQMLMKPVGRLDFE